MNTPYKQIICSPIADLMNFVSLPWYSVGGGGGGGLEGLAPERVARREIQRDR